MLKQGLVQETLKVLDRGWETRSPLSSVGYREVLQYLKEIKTEDWLEENIYRSTMQLAKKQRTWFQRDPQIKWFHPDQDQKAVVAAVEKFVYTS